MKILVAEDDPTSRLIMTKRLQSWGYDVGAANDGQQAWEYLVQHEIQFVITDWMMPGLDGIQLCQKIRQAALPRYTYIILLTAKGHKEDLIIGMDSGADDYLTKPFDTGELQARIRAGERILQLEGTLAARNRALAQANEIMRRDLEAAAKIQASLLPLEAPISSFLRFAWDFRPSDFVAGDIFNLFKIDDKRIGIYVLDVSGHGVPAAMLAVTLSRILTPPLQGSANGHGTPAGRGLTALTPGVVATTLNNRFQMDEETSQYFTMIYGIFDTSSLVFSYINAGHPPPIVVGADGRAVMENAQAPPIGMVPAVVFNETHVKLSAADRVFLYTDGLVEAQNSRKEFFGSNLLDYAVASKGKPIGEHVREIMTTFGKWIAPATPNDDVTLIGIEVVSRPEARA